MRDLTRRLSGLARDWASGPLGMTRQALAILLAMFTVQLYFAFGGCEWDLSLDEAFYWDWSRHLDWGYATKGPLVAWLIRLSTTLAGAGSVLVSGTLAPAVRLPAVLLGALTAWGVFRLGTATCPGSRAGLIALLLLPAVPLFAAGGLLMTDDAPFLCSWTWAAVWAWKGIERDDGRAWLAAGGLGALGVLAKYSMLAFPVSVGLFLLLSPSHRRQLTRPGFWSMAVLCGLGMAPILAWNARHHWVGTSHLGGRVGLTHSSWGGLPMVLVFLGGQAAVLGGIWWLLGVEATARACLQIRKPSEDVPAREVDERSGLLYLLCLGAVIWLAALLASLRNNSQPNWLAPACVSALVLIGWRVDQALSIAPRHRKLATAWFCGGCWALSVAVLLVLHHTEWLYPTLARYLPPPSVERKTPLRQLDPTCRMRGYRGLAAEVARRVEALRARGVEPFILTPEYGLASSLSFYLPGRPEVPCLGGLAGLTTQVGSQHDLWRPNPRLDPDVYRGRSAIVVELIHNRVAPWWTRVGLFASAEPMTTVIVSQHGVPVNSWHVTVCHDFRGLAALGRLVDAQGAPNRGIQAHKGACAFTGAGLASRSR